MKYFTRIIILGSIFILTGCITAKYEDGKGRTLTVSNGIFNTKIGKVIAKSSDGDELTIENYDGESQMIELTKEVVSKIPSK